MDDSTLHVQSRITISTDGDFLEVETLLRDTSCGCALLLVHLFCDYNLVIILSFAVLEL